MDGQTTFSTLWVWRASIIPELSGQTELRLMLADGSERILHDGTAGLSERATACQRLPAGHPEGFIEAFANLYGNVARTLDARAGRAEPGPFDDDFPSVQDGARGVYFIQAALQSAESGSWVPTAYKPPA